MNAEGNASESESRTPGGNAARRRARSSGRLYWLPRGLTPTAHLCFAFALCAVLPVYVALPVSALAYALTIARFKRAISDHKRSIWITRLIDIPLFWHWGGSALLLLTSPVWLLCLLIANTIAHSPARSLPSAAADWALGAYLLGLLISGFTLTIGRLWVRVRTIEVAIPNLPKAFDGYRIAQLSDLHIGSFDPKARGLRWAKLANGLGADLIVVTGDLVTSGTEFYEDVRDVLAALRAPDGVVVSMGNHDQWDNQKLTSLLSERNLIVLKNQALTLEREHDQLSLAGLDDAYTGRADLAKTIAACAPGNVKILLAHYPQFFQQAAEAGVALTLSGHTHGGQIGVPFLGDRYNIATLRADYARGLYRRGKSTLYVNAGLGTTGPPMRLGVPPEIALVVLKVA